MKSNNFTKKFIAIMLSVVMITGLIPYQVFADTNNAKSKININDKIKINDKTKVNDKTKINDKTKVNDKSKTNKLNNSVNTTTKSAVTFKNSNSERTFDISNVDYKRACQKFGVKYESKWEGVAPYAPLFGQYVKSGKETRPLGDSEWGNNDWMTGYLMVDLKPFGKIGTEGLPKDSYGLSSIGIVRVDNKNIRTDDFNTWNDSIVNAFKEYNGNLGFGKNGYSNKDVNQSTKLVIWDGYRRIQGFKPVVTQEYVKSIKDVASDSTEARQKFSNFVKKHLNNGAKLQGFITVADGLKDIYEPTRMTYKHGEKQIVNIPQIKITGLTYDVELEHKNAPKGVELSSVIKVQAETKLSIPNVDGYETNITYQDGSAYKSKKVDRNLKLIVNWNSDDEPFEDIGENYYKKPKPEDIIIDEKTGIPYVKNQLLISALKGLDKSVVEKIVDKVGAEIVGYIELTNDYQIEFKEDKTLEEISQIAEYIDSHSFIAAVTLNIVILKETNDENSKLPNDKLYEDDEWNESVPKGDNWGLEALYVPSVWAYKDEFKTVKVGIYDEGFDTSHEDVHFNDVKNNISDVYKQDHGTHVAGILAAKHNNKKGISGIATKTKLYGYAFMGDEVQSSMGKKSGFAVLIGNNVKVINASVGLSSEICFVAGNPEVVGEKKSKKAKKYINDTANILAEYLNKLVASGYDFVIVTAAGNGSSDKFIESTGKDSYLGFEKYSSKNKNHEGKKTYEGTAYAHYNSEICAIKDENLKKRIIVVGAIQNNGENRNFELTDFSNIGNRVDFVAPGYKILSSVPFGYNPTKYELKNGTSMASPYIASIVAMMYQVNPGLKGSNIKSLISKSCKESVKKGGYVYKLPNAVGCYTQAKNAPSEENDISWPSGIVTGITKNDDDELLGNVKITAVRKSTGEYNLGKYSFVFQSDEKGNYIQTLPQGTYDLIISKEGYLPYVYNDLVVKPDETNYVETIFLSFLSGILTDNKVQGNVKNALNGNPIEGAVVKFRTGWNNKDGVYCKKLLGGVKQTKTDANGNFDYGIFCGTYTAEISKDGYVTAYYNVISGPSGKYSALSQVDIVLTPILENDEYRIILTWGSEPKDLDSHLTYYVGNEKKCHVFYSNKEAEYNGKIIGKLDLDDTSSYGPETVTTTVKKDVISGSNKFSYSIHDFSNRNSSNSSQLSLSGATIHVYSGNNLINKFIVPKDKVGTVWHVFDITSSGIKKINNFYNCSNPTEVR